MHRIPNTYFNIGQFATVNATMICDGYQMINMMQELGEDYLLYNVDPKFYKDWF